MPRSGVPPLPTSGEGATGTPRQSFRCPHELWGAAINRAAGTQAPGGLSGVIRRWLAAYVAGELDDAMGRG